MFIVCLSSDLQELYDNYQKIPLIMTIEKSPVTDGKGKSIYFFLKLMLYFSIYISGFFSISLLYENHNHAPKTISER